MSLTSICSRHPLSTLIAVAVLVYGTAAIAGGGIQLQDANQVQASANNPHQIPDHMNPKSRSLSDEIKLIKVEIRQDVTETSESIHAIAFHGRQDKSQAILDYTTGTSN